MNEPIAIAFAALVLAGLGACGDDGAPEPDAGPPPRDAGPPPMALRYTPEGCSYEVRVQPLSESGEGGDVLGAAPSLSQVHVSWAGPTDSTFAVNWRSDLETTVSDVIFGTDRAAVEAAEGEDAGAGVLLRSGHHLFFEDVTGVQLRLHEVHVCGLDPSTVYYYKVGGMGTWSAVHEVATGPVVGSSDPIRFAVTGDSRNEAIVFAEIQRRLRDEAVDFQIFTGDAVEFGFNQADWDAWFAAEFDGIRVEDALADSVLMPSVGNHDGLADNYVLQFALPQEESPLEQGGGEQWYAFDYGGAHIVVLDTSTPNELVEGPQAEWLEADLAAVDRAVTPWVFALHHYATYSCSHRHGSQIDIRAAWQPSYDRHGVDVVFTGHDHNYERSLPIRGLDAMGEGVVAVSGPDGEPVDESGTVYVVSGGSGAPLYGIDADCYHTRAAESTHNYVVVELDGRTLRYAAYRLDGTLLDSFEYTK